MIGVAVYYDVGIRSEPEGRTGFAHLFEHLMFQGSASLGKMEHIRYVESSGGWLNGSTRLDFTNYYEALPGPRPRTRPVPRGRPDALTGRHRGEPRQPDRRGRGGDPGQRAQPALRRLPLADPARRAVRDLPQRPRRVRRLRRARERHGRRRPRLLRPLLRARQRGARRLGRPRPRRDRRPGRAPLRRHPAASRPGPARLRRAGPHLRATRRSTSTRRPRLRPWRSAGGCPTRPTSRRTCRCWRWPACSARATPRG